MWFLTDEGPRSVVSPSSVSVTLIFRGIHVICRRQLRATFSDLLQPRCLLHTGVLGLIRIHLYSTTTADSGSENAGTLLLTPLVRISLLGLLHLPSITL